MGCTISTESIDNTVIATPLPNPAGDIELDYAVQAYGSEYCNPRPFGNAYSASCDDGRVLTQEADFTCPGGSVLENGGVPVDGGIFSVLCANHTGGFPNYRTPRALPTPDLSCVAGTGGKGGASGDPHFQTWTGDKYDYHGECDLVLVDNPTFADGLGLRVHIRTTAVSYFSFIEKVAVQIGDNTLEFDNDVENFLIDGAMAEEGSNYKVGGFEVRRYKSAISIRLEDHADKKAKIDMHTRKTGFPAIFVDGGSTNIFEGSLGLMGDWATGKRLARDGKTEFKDDDTTAFALEWQVRNTEPMLFTEARFPQFPTICTAPPHKDTFRLGASKFKKEAEQACAHWKEHKEDCIFDVMATRDVLVAAEGHIVHIN